MIINPIVIFITFAILSIVAYGIGINVIRLFEKNYTIPVGHYLLEATIIGHVPLVIIIYLILYSINS